MNGSKFENLKKTLTYISEATIDRELAETPPDAARITSEKDLSDHVAIPKYPYRDFQCLLEAMGYTQQHVAAQASVQFASRDYYADFLIGVGGNQWVLELKEPGQLAKRGRTQLLSYMIHKECWLGVLYNGNSAQLFVQDPKKAGSDGKMPEPYEVANDMEAMAAIFSRLSVIDSLPDVKKVAKEILAKERQKQSQKQKIEEKVGEMWKAWEEVKRDKGFQKMLCQKLAPNEKPTPLLRTAVGQFLESIAPPSE